MPNKLLAILLDCGDTLVDEATEVKDETGTSLRAELIPGAAEVVRELKSRGYKLALVADGPSATFVNNLGHYGLYELFDGYAISEVLGVMKPDARMFHHALEALEIHREEYDRVIMVGNNLERDIKGANELGILSVWLNWSPRRRKTPLTMAEVPSFTIRNPNELLGLIDELEVWLPSE
jgi:putative hydrolase of the HAD superfamily